MDFETSGLPQADAAPLNTQPHAIEFAAIKTDDELNELEKIEFICKPPIEISAKITEITGLTNNDLKDKPSFEYFLPKLTEFFLGVKTVIAHNLPFDENIMKYELRRLNRLTKFPWPPNHICTVEKTFHIKGYRLNLSKMHNHLVGMPHENGAHRAMADVEALLRCVKALTIKGILNFGEENGKEKGRESLGNEEIC